MESFADLIERIGITGADTAQDALKKLADCRESRMAIVERWREKGAGGSTVKDKQRQYMHRLKATNKRLVEQLCSARKYIQHSRATEDRAWVLAAGDIEELQITNAMLGKELAEIKTHRATDLTEMEILRHQTQIMKNQQKAMISKQKTILQALRESHAQLQTLKVGLASKQTEQLGRILTERDDLKKRLSLVSGEREELQMRILQMRKQQVALLTKERRRMSMMQEIESRHAKLYQKIEKSVEQRKNATSTENGTAKRKISPQRLAELERMEEERDRLLEMRNCMESKLRYTEAELSMLQQKFKDQASFSQKIMTSSYKKALKQSQKKQVLLDLISRGVALLATIRTTLDRQNHTAQMVKEREVSRLAVKIDEQSTRTSCIQAENEQLHRLLQKINDERDAKRSVHTKFAEMLTECKSKHAKVAHLIETKREKAGKCDGKERRTRGTAEPRPRSERLSDLRSNLEAQKKRLEWHGVKLAQLCTVNRPRENKTESAAKVSLEPCEGCAERERILESQTLILQKHRDTERQKTQLLKGILLQMGAQLGKMQVVSSRHVELLAQRDEALERAEGATCKLSHEIDELNKSLQREQQKLQTLTRVILPKLIKYLHIEDSNFRAVCAYHVRSRAKAANENRVIEMEMESASKMTVSRLEQRVGELEGENAKLREEESRLLRSNKELAEKHLLLVESCKAHHDILQKMVRLYQARRGGAPYKERLLAEDVAFLMEYCKGLNGKLSDTEAELIQAYNFIQIKLRQDQLQALPADIRPRAVRDCLEAELSWLKRLPASPRLPPSSDMDTCDKVEDEARDGMPSSLPGRVFSSGDEMLFEIDTKPSSLKSAEKDTKSKCMCIN